MIEDGQTDRQTDTLIAVLRSSNGDGVTRNVCCGDGDVACCHLVIAIEVERAVGSLTTKECAKKNPLTFKRYNLRNLWTKKKVIMYG